MKDYIGRSYEMPDDGPYEELIRLSPLDAELNHDPYRCPVSTPAGNLRLMKQPHPSYASYNSLNRSMQMSDKSQRRSKIFSRRLSTKTQKKNFDCYFVKRIDKTAHIDIQTQSTWLSSLCSQPVNEIFGKYQRKSHSHPTKTQAVIRNTSTPGEKALLSAWSGNTSQHGTNSPVSRSSTSMYGSPQRMYRDPFVRVQNTSSAKNRAQPSPPTFALMPVATPTTITFDPEMGWSPRESPDFRSMIRDESRNQRPLSNKAKSLDSSIYDAYQRDRRFPEIRRRKATFSPTKKSVSSEPSKLCSPTPSVMPELEESPMHIISVGQNDIPTDSPPDQKKGGKKPGTPKPYACEYRLPKKMLTTLPELHGKG